jgi:cystathionine beta-lyase/cystathionine gamma-synthase
MDLSYILNHLGENRDEYYGAVAPPIIQSSNFYFKTVEQMRNAFINEQSTSIYTRGNNPTIAMTAQKIAAMEGADDALLLASGSAAIAMAIMSQVKAGDHIVCVNHPYSWTYKLLTHFLPRFNISTTFIDGRDVDNFKNATQPNTTLYYLESPNTMYFELQDLTTVASLAKQNNIKTIIDNSYCTMLVQQPIKLGIDIVVYSATKYLNGHSDVVAGVICSNCETIKKIFHNEFMTLGAIISPWNAWLLMRGLRTLPLRINHISKSVVEIVNFLKQHPAVEKIYWPFDEDHFQFALAKKQMSKPLGLFSILLKTQNTKQIQAFCESLKYFLMAVSWGGHESLIIPAIAFHPPHDYPVNFIRFYIGLEETDVLISDLKEALTFIQTD